MNVHLAAAADQFYALGFQIFHRRVHVVHREGDGVNAFAAGFDGAANRRFRGQGRDDFQKTAIGELEISLFDADRFGLGPAVQRHSQVVPIGFDAFLDVFDAHDDVVHSGNRHCFSPF